MSYLTEAPVETPEPLASGPAPLSSRLIALPVRDTMVKPECQCGTCRPNTWGDMRMILCETCGNKRCPHATDHQHACTNSNEPGQPGSRYAHVKPLDFARNY